MRDQQLQSDPVKIVAAAIARDIHPDSVPRAGRVLSPTALELLLLLLVRTDSFRGAAPEIRITEICARLRRSRSAVGKAVKALEATGFLEVERPYASGRDLINRYHLILPDRTGDHARRFDLSGIEDTLRETLPDLRQTLASEAASVSELRRVFAQILP